MTGKSPEVMIDEMCNSLQIEIDCNSREMLLKYVDMLLRGLKKQRLTGERSLEGLIGKQLYDSLYPLKVINFAVDSKVLDIGSGGGLPGLPLKICLPEIYMYLLDSNKRKITFLQNTVEGIGLKRVYFLNKRAEELGQNSEHREQFDYVLSKAVAEMAVLAELSLPFLKIGGKAIFYKGPRGKKEAHKAKKAIELCGGEIIEAWDYFLDTGEERSLYLLRKTGETPLQYPRRVGKPGKKPLE